MSRQSHDDKNAWYLAGVHIKELTPEQRADARQTAVDTLARLEVERKALDYDGLKMPPYFEEMAEREQRFIKALDELP